MQIHPILLFFPILDHHVFDSLNLSPYYSHYFDWIKNAWIIDLYLNHSTAKLIIITSLPLFKYEILPVFKKLLTNPNISIHPGFDLICTKTVWAIFLLDQIAEIYNYFQIMQQKDLQTPCFQLNWKYKLFKTVTNKPAYQCRVRRLLRTKVVLAWASGHLL